MEKEEAGIVDTDREATIETIQDAVADMWKILNSVALLFVGVVKLIGFSCMNIAYNLFRWKRLKSDKRISDSQTIDWHLRAVHPERSDMQESTSDDDELYSSQYLCNRSPVRPGSTVRRRRQQVSFNFPEKPSPVMQPSSKMSVVDSAALKNELIVTKQPVATLGPSYFNMEEVESKSEVLETSREGAEGVKTQQSKSGILKEESEEIEKPGRCLSCCGIWLEFTDGLIP